MPIGISNACESLPKDNLGDATEVNFAENHVEIYNASLW